jgi:site-specific recombinase
MDNDPQAQLIEARLDALDGMPVADDPTARDAFTHAMITVNRINQISARAHAQAMTGAAVPIDDILERLRNWLDRLVSALTRIVAELADAASFSISVGTALTVTVNFRPSAAIPAPPGTTTES